MARPKTLGGPVTVTLVPPGMGLQRLTVRSLDRAGNASDEVTCMILVGDTTPIAAVDTTPSMGVHASG